MQPSDIARVRTLSHPQVHPDGRSVVFTVARPDLDEDHTDSALWLWDGDRVRQFTRGPHDSRPRWSPDGRRLAFLRKGPADDDRAQVMVMAADGGEPTPVTDFDLGASEAELASRRRPGRLPVGAPRPPGPGSREPGLRDRRRGRGSHGPDRAGLVRLGRSRPRRHHPGRRPARPARLARGADPVAAGSGRARAAAR